MFGARADCSGKFQGARWSMQTALTAANFLGALTSQRKQKGGLIPPRLLHDMRCCLFESEPNQIVFEVSTDLKILPGLVYPFLTKRFDFIVMLVEKGMCISVVGVCSG
jgi:hypothetical protein